MTTKAPTLSELRPEYAQLWREMAYRPGYERMAEKVARRLLSNLDRYLALESLCTVPAAFLMCAHERESGGDWTTYLGNGQPLNRVTTIVPKGRGPFRTFEEGALDAVRLQHLDGIARSEWDEATLAYWLEAFNGFGYRLYKHVPSPYLWGGTTHQKPGKYVADNVFDPGVMDPQLGGMAVYGQVVRLHPELDLGGPAGGPLFLKQASTGGVEGSSQPTRDALRKLQEALVACGESLPSGADGVVGDETRSAYRRLGVKLGVIKEEQT